MFKKPAFAGKRVGTKRSDMRWLDGDGVEWDSRLEAEVYASAKVAGRPVRKCNKGKPGIPDSDTLEYWHSSTGRSSCRACGSADVGQPRSFTPDLLHDPALLPAGSKQVHPTSGVDRYYVDVKGYIRADKRALLRAFHKARPDIDLRLIFQRDYRLSKTATVTQWCHRTLRLPYALWTGKFPTEADWINPYVKEARKANPKGRRTASKELLGADPVPNRNIKEHNT